MTPVGGGGRVLPLFLSNHDRSGSDVQAQGISGPDGLYDSGIPWFCVRSLCLIHLSPSTVPCDSGCWALQYEWSN